MRNLRFSLFLLLLCAASTPMFAVCLNGGTDATIQAALGTTANSEAVLCQGSVFSIYNTIQFKASGQKIYTEGLPDLTGHALLEVKSSNVVMVIDGMDDSYVQVRNLMIEGNREIYGFVRPGPAMIQLGGNATGQVVSGIEAFNPRGWTAIHIFEGSPSYNGSTWSGGCTGATISNNWIGGAGVVDAQGNWADGISHACRNSTISGNFIQNATDGGIVVFGAPGSIIENNTIEVTSEALGGINMVDMVYNGDFTGTIVRNNTIRAINYIGFGPAPFLHVGIAIGPRTWFGCNTQSVKNGTVTGNYFEGGVFGYAIAVDGATNFTVTGNTLSTSFAAGGRAAHDSCSGYAAAPGAFKKHGVHSTGTYQSNFVEGLLHRAAAVTPY